MFDSLGKNIEHTGQPGELVCTRPHPSLPLGFWGDESGEKLRDAYFNTYPGLWHLFHHVDRLFTMVMALKLQESGGKGTSSLPTPLRKG